MAKPPFTLNASGYELSRVQQWLSDAVKRIPTDYPITNGNFVDAALSGTDKEVTHGLGRTPRGFIPVMLDAGATVYKSGTAPADATRTIVLKASTPVNATLYFF